jgi:F-type H+-transporting ATPase subunit a
MEGAVLGSVQLGLSNIGFYLLVGLSLILTLNLFSTIGEGVARRNTWQLAMESLFGFVLNLVKSQIGTVGQLFFPSFYSLFLFILFSNLIGLVPYSFAPFAQMALSIGFSCTILLGVTILGFIKHGVNFFSLFVPSGCPLFLVPFLVLIETVSYLARALSLGLRLGANLISGHILLKVLSSLTWTFFFSSGSLISVLLAPLPILFLIAIFALELGVAFLQAYVFVLLSMNYLNDALCLHSESSQNSPVVEKALAMVLFTASNARLVTPVLSQIRHYRRPDPPLYPPPNTRTARGDSGYCSRGSLHK